MSTLGTVLADARKTLLAAGIDSAGLDARLLIGAVLDVPPGRIPLEASRTLSGAQEQTVARFIERRAAREPVARILGDREFWGMPFRLSPETLEPRPDTETLVEAALSRIDAKGRRNDRLRLADLGTGSGALLVALLKECPNATGIGTDISEGALATARSNAVRNRVGERAAFACMSYCDGLNGGFDLVISNPPYIESGMIGTLEPEVCRHDPRRALDGGADGLKAYRSILASVTRLLCDGGNLLVEIGAGQADTVTGMFHDAGLASICVFRDIAGNRRVVAARHH